MNISSLVLNTIPENIEQIIDFVKGIEGCEYHFHKKNGQIIITIEAEDGQTESSIVRHLRKDKRVISLTMVYSYCEDEINEKEAALLKEKAVPKWMNEENIDLKNIPSYGGDLRKKNL